MSKKQPFEATCRMCNQVTVLEIDPQDVIQWVNGKYAQDAFPYLSDDERELLITKTCGKCFDKMFS